VKGRLSQIFEIQNLLNAVDCLAQELTREEQSRVYSTSPESNLKNTLGLRDILNGKPVPRRLKKHYNHNNAIKRLGYDFRLKVRHRLFIRIMKSYTGFKYK
jgi:hypothetical protein